MIKHNLINILKTFTKSDLKKFEDYLLSPYFNTSRKMIGLFKEIVKYYPDFENENFNKKNLSIHTSSAREYNDSTLRDALSNLLKLVLNFLAVRRIEKERPDFENYLLSELQERNIDSLFEKRMLEFSNAQNKNFKIDSRQLYNKYWFSTLSFNYDYTRNKVLHKTDAVKKIECISNLAFDLLIFYETEMISNMLNTLVLSSKYNVNLSNNPLLKLDFLSDIDKAIQNYPKENLTILYLYRALLICFQHFDNDNFYFEYKNLLNKFLDKLSRDEISFHFDWLINYCLEKKKKGNNNIDLEQELFSLYNTVIENKYYTNKKTEYISTSLFRDIVIQGLDLKKFSWVNKFINEFCKVLSPIDRENVYNFSYAYYYFTIRDFEKALEYYNKVIIDTFVYKYDLKNLVVKTYFELGYLEEALAEIKSYREFLRTNILVSNERKIRTGNFLKYLEELILSKYDKPRSDIFYLENQLLKNNNVVQRKWLLEKIEIMKKKKNRND